jgi:hypothetical protein
VILEQRLKERTMALEKSLCDLEKQGFVFKNFKAYRKLVRYGKFVCVDCGRVARKKSSLCSPKLLYPKDKVVK